MRRSTLAILAATSVLLIAACNRANDDGVVGGGNIPTTAVTTATTSTSTTTPSGPAKTPQAAADGLYNAWTHNDQKDASNYAQPQPIAALFKHPYTPGGATYSRQPCTPQGGQFNCAWTYEGGSMQMTVEDWPGGGYVVSSVIFVAD